MKRLEHRHKYTWPDLVVIEFLTAVALTIILLVWALLVNAPLLEVANPGISENPSKAPWYFIGLQELLVYFDPWIAGVVIPIIIVTSLIMLPYLDNNPAGAGWYNYSQRRFAVTNFIIGFCMWWALIGGGYFFRGYNWQFYLPWESGDMSNGVEERLWSPPTWIGLLSLGLYFVGGMALPWLLSKRTFRGWGVVRYIIIIFLLLIMYLVPIKIMLRLLFHIRYILVTRWFNI
ncbi:MAG: hypothetical protein Fur0020_09870 [Thermodesulfovibrionia bacterium]